MKQIERMMMQICLSPTKQVSFICSLPKAVFAGGLWGNCRTPTMLWLPGGGPRKFVG